MTAFADLTLNDGQATPVAHTFKARRIDGIIAKYQDISGGIAIGYPMVTISSREPVNGSENYKVSAKVILPVLETISGTSYAGIVASPTLAYNLTFTGEFILPSRSTLAVRKDILAYAKNLLSNAVVTAVVQDLDFVS
jgi:hypothetical protein